jgi:hypothetical protein
MLVGRPTRTSVASVFAFLSTFKHSRWVRWNLGWLVPSEFLTTTISVLLAGRSLDDALSSVWTLLGTSFGLSVSALATAVNNELPLYQAIIVTDLVALANYAIFMALATYNRHPKGSDAVQYTAIAQTYFSMSCMLYLWARAPSLESDGHTGKTVFVVLFISTSGTGTGRTVALLIVSGLFIAYSVVAANFGYGRVFPVEAPPPSPPKEPRPPTDSSRPSAKLASGRQPPPLSMDPHLLILAAFFAIPYIITLSSTELQIRRNQLCSENSFWGFGQVCLSVVLYNYCAHRLHRFWP